MNLKEKFSETWKEKTYIAMKIMLSTNNNRRKICKACRNIKTIFHQETNYDRFKWNTVTIIQNSHNNIASTSTRNFHNCNQLNLLALYLQWYNRKELYKNLIIAHKVHSLVQTFSATSVSPLLFTALARLWHVGGPNLAEL